MKIPYKYKLQYCLRVPKLVIAIMQPQSNDTLSLHKQIRLTTQLDKQQKILFSCELLKYNDSCKCQPRIFMLTDIAVYNLIERENFIKSMMSKLVTFNKKFSIKRKICYNTIEAITMGSCENSEEFIIHVRNQYDYRYRVDDRNMKKLLLKCLCLQFEKIMKRKMAFYFKNDLSLAQYCTMKSDMKTKICRMPTENRVYLDVQDLVDYEVSGSNFELLYSYNGKKVQISKFVSCTLEKLLKGHQYYSIQSKTIKYVSIEQMLTNRHPFLYLPHYVFRVSEHLYKLRPFMIGGKMDKLVATMGAFKAELCIFYIAQVIIALEFLHAKMWVYRAANLSNIYIKESGYIAVDGLNKLMRKKNKKEQLFYDICGLPEDLAPEMILCSGHDESIDVWGLGICAYNMITGHHPFASYNTKETFRNILQKKIEQSELMPNFIHRALQKDPKLRPNLAQIKKDPCFKSISWQQIEKQTKISPYIPQFTSVAAWEGKLPSIVCLQQNGKK